MKKTQQEIIEDGITYNIQDAKNTIKQIKAYLGCIYELLLKSIDQLLKLTSDTNTVGDFNNEHLQSVVAIVNEYIKELQHLVNNAQYNGRELLAEIDSTTTSIVFRMVGNNGKCRTVNNIYNDFTINLPVVGPAALGLLGFMDDFSDVFM